MIETHRLKNVVIFIQTILIIAEILKKLRVMYIHCLEKFEWEVKDLTKVTIIIVDQVTILGAWTM